MSNDIPAAVMDAVAACAAYVAPGGQRIEIGDRDAVLRWLVYQDRRAEARWVVTHPAEYRRVVESVPYWRRMQGAA